MIAVFICCAVNLRATEYVVDTSNGLNAAILSSVSGDTITITSDIIMDANLSSISGKSIIIQSSDTSKTLSGDNNFAGFVITNSTASFSGLNFSSFTRNSGVVISANSSSVTFYNQDSINFNDNISTGGYGGVFCGVNAVFSIDAENVNFDNNKTSTLMSGAIYIQTSSLFNITASSNVNFLNNSAATNGGAIFVENSSFFINAFGVNFTGSDEYNQKLSERRAKKAYDYLTGLGIEKERIRYEGKGKREPIADNRSKEGRAKNRRVEVLETSNN